MLSRTLLSLSIALASCALAACAPAEEETGSQVGNVESSDDLVASRRQELTELIDVYSLKVHEHQDSGMAVRVFETKGDVRHDGHKVVLSITSGKQTISWEPDIYTVSITSVRIVPSQNAITLNVLEIGPNYETGAISEVDASYRLFYDQVEDRVKDSLRVLRFEQDWGTVSAIEGSFLERVWGIHNERIGDYKARLYEVDSAVHSVNRRQLNIQVNQRDKYGERSQDRSFIWQTDLRVAKVKDFRFSLGQGISIDADVAVPGKEKSYDLKPTTYRFGVLRDRDQKVQNRLENYGEE